MTKSRIKTFVVLMAIVLLAVFGIAALERRDVQGAVYALSYEDDNQSTDAVPDAEIIPDEEVVPLPNESEDELPQSLVIGLSVGVPLGIIAIVVPIIFIIRRRES